MQCSWMSGHAVPRYLKYISEIMHVVVPALRNKQVDRRLGYAYIQSILSEGGGGGRWWGGAGGGGAGGGGGAWVSRTNSQSDRETKTKTDRRDREAGGRDRHRVTGERQRQTGRQAGRQADRD